MRRLPEAVLITEQEEKQGIKQVFMTKEDVLKFLAKIKSAIIFWFKRLWHFVLEAKGMRHQSVVGYRIKQIFKAKPKRPSVDGLTSRPEPQSIRDENYYLMKIKNDPHNLENYNSLGEYYLDTLNYQEAGNVYEYLVNHDSGNSAPYAKNAYCKLQLGLYQEAVELYQKSIALDATHPNRFYNLAVAYEDLEDYEGAIASAKTALDLEPTNAKYQKMVQDLDIKLKK